jgi:hypothetical protein
VLLLSLCPLCFTQYGFQLWFGSNSGSWKELASRRPYYELLRKVTDTSTITANWHRVPAAKEDIAVILSAEFVDLHVEPYSARLEVSFKDKLQGPPARTWVEGFAAEQSISMQIQKIYQSGFHLLQIFGEVEEADKARDKILEGSPHQYNGWWGTFSPIMACTDLEHPLGLKQIVAVTFTSDLPWLEEALPQAFGSFGKVLRHTCDRRGFTDFYCVIVEYSKSYFETKIRLLLPDREERLELNYKGLAFRCYTCGSLYHPSLSCLLRVPPPVTCRRAPSPPVTRCAPSPPAAAPVPDEAVPTPPASPSPDVKILPSPPTVYPEIIIIPESPEPDSVPAAPPVCESFLACASLKPSFLPSSSDVTPDTVSRPSAQSDPAAFMTTDSSHPPSPHRVTPIKGLSPSKICCLAQTARAPTPVPSSLSLFPGISSKPPEHSGTYVFLLCKCAHQFTPSSDHVVPHSKCSRSRTTAYLP